MNEFFTNIPLDEFTQSARQMLPEMVMHALTVRFYMFVLVLIRISGLMVIGPIFGQSLVPPTVRVLLIFSISIMITPALEDHSVVAFRTLDENHDGQLVRDEVPDPLLPRYEQLLRDRGRSGQTGLSHAEFYLPPAIPPTVVELAIAIAGEFALGLVLGLGVMTLINGLQIAGQVIDQQTGLALGNVFNPGVDISGTVTGKTYYLLGITAFLLLEPLGGHLLMMSSLLDSFQVLPVGEAYVSRFSVDLLSDLVHQSLSIGLLLAAPMIATMALVGIAMGFLGHTVPQVNILVVGFPLRSIIALLILTLTMSGAAEIIVDQVPHTIQDLRNSLTGLR